MSIGNRLREIRETKGFTQTKMAQILGIAQNNLHRYESDSSKLTTDKLELLYQIDVNIEWLLTGKGEMFGNPQSSVTSQEIIKIPLLDVKASAGTGFVNYDESAIDWVSVPAVILKQYNPTYVQLLEVRGDSMKPTFLDGEWILVSTQHRDLLSERIYVIKVNDELKVKRLDKDIRGNIIIASDNPAFKREELTPNEFTDYNVEIIGMVFGVLKKI